MRKEILRAEDVVPGQLLTHVIIEDNKGIVTFESLPGIVQSTESYDSYVNVVTYNDQTDFRDEFKLSRNYDPIAMNPVLGHPEIIRSEFVVRGAV